ncbi:unnamed protein product, partial [Sphagnum jensenii]
MTLLLEIELHRILEESENMLLGIMQVEFFFFCWKVKMLLLFDLLKALIKSSSKVKKNSSSALGVLIIIIHSC